jgi:sugar/nucleoside kinase (ribokinase family)
VVCTLGDLLLDVVVRLEAPIAEDTDTYGRTQVGAGGQAANVAAWVAVLGGRARFIGKRARDLAGRLVGQELQLRGVELAGPETNGTTGTVVSIATPEGKRAMLTDRGVSPDFRSDELDPGWLAGCAWLHLPGYSLARPPLRDTALAAAGLVRDAGADLSIDLSSVGAIAAVGADRFGALLRELRPRVAFATEEEADLVGDLEAETVAVKRGERGCVLRRGGEERELPAEPAELVDATGAGDAFAAGFLVGGPELALRAAARCVAKMGAMP